MSGTAGILALLGFVWYPNGDYKPIQPGERGTVQGAIGQLKSFSTGRPGLPGERERDLGGAPAVSDEGTVEEEQPGEEPQPSETSTEPAATTGATTGATTTTTATTTEPTTTGTTTTSP